MIALVLGLSIMYHYVPDAREYFRAVLDHAFTLGAGCAATVMLGLIQKFRGKPLSPKWEAAIFLGFLFFACFQAWQDQHQRAVQADAKLNDLTKPQLVCKIGSLTFGKGHLNNSDDLIAVIAGTITNVGGPTVLDYWTLASRLPDGSIVRAEPIIPMGHGGRLTLNGPIGFDAADWWAAQAQSAPISKGGAASGWLYFIFRGDSATKLKTRGPTSVILGVTDVNGKGWTFETAVNDIPSASTPISPGDVMELHVDENKLGEKSRVHRENPHR